MTAAITDYAQYAELRHGAEGQDPAALREVAGQFEALFVQSMLESMRDASLGDPLFGDNEGHEMYRDLLDQQLAVDVSSGKGIGLAELLVRQLGGEPPPDAGPEYDYPLNRLSDGNDVAVARHAEAGGYSMPRDNTSAGFALTRRSSAEGSMNAVRRAATSERPATYSPTKPDVPEAREPGPNGSMPAYGWSDPASFARELWPHAQRVASMLDIAPEAVMAQAALETGWGRHVMPAAHGGISNNLFGIKASGDWQGDSVTHSTLEFADGVARQEVARFRAYDDLADSFDDYTKLLAANPRYREVLGQGNDVEGFARAIADSGYATDPDYAEKISRVANGDLMNRVLAPLKNVPALSIQD